MFVRELIEILLKMRPDAIITIATSRTVRVNVEHVDAECASYDGNVFYPLREEKEYSIVSLNVPRIPNKISVT
jgi:hypothetical protein